jgi:hypothetical protein
VHGGDRRLQLIRPGAAVGKGGGNQGGALVDLGPVPAGAVLLGERDRLTLSCAVRAASRASVSSISATSPTIGCDLGPRKTATEAGDPAGTVTALREDLAGQDGRAES